MASRELFDKIKAFGMTNSMLVEDISGIEKLYGIELGHIPAVAEAVEHEYYPQLDAAVRAEAASGLIPTFDARA